MPSDSALERSPSENHTWVVVAETGGVIEAEILAGLLRTANIPYRIHQESMGRIMGLMLGALGQVTLLVPLQYEQEAVALLDEGNLDDFSLLLDPPPLQPE